MTEKIELDATKPRVAIGNPQVGGSSVFVDGSEVAKLPGTGEVAISTAGTRRLPPRQSRSFDAVIHNAHAVLTAHCSPCLLWSMDNELRALLPAACVLLLAVGTACAQEAVCPNPSTRPRPAAAGTAHYVLYESGGVERTTVGGSQLRVRVATGGPRLVRIDLIRNGEPTLLACGDVAGGATFELPDTDNGTVPVPLRARDLLRVRVYGPRSGTWPTTRSSAYQRELMGRAHALDQQLDVWMHVMGSRGPALTRARDTVYEAVHSGAGPTFCAAEPGWQRVYQCDAGRSTVLTKAVGRLDAAEVPGAFATAQADLSTACGSSAATDVPRCTEARRLVALLGGSGAEAAMEERGERLEHDLRAALGAHDFATTPRDGGRELYPLAEFELPTRFAASRFDTTFDAGSNSPDRAAGDATTLVVRGVPAGTPIAFGDRAETDDEGANAVVAFLRFALAPAVAGGRGLPPDQFATGLIKRRDDRTPPIASITTAVHFFGESTANRRHLLVCEGARCVQEGDGANVRTELVLERRQDFGVALLIDASTNLSVGEAYGTPSWQLQQLPPSDPATSACGGTSTSVPCYRLTSGTAGIVTGSVLLGLWVRAGGTRLAWALGATFTPDVSAGMLFQGDFRFGVEVFPTIFFTIGLGLRVVRASDGFAIGHIEAGTVMGSSNIAPVLTTGEGVHPLLTLGVAADLIGLGKAAADLVDAL
ncbi:MAG: hypothetical protein K8H88_24495 [Sandaracinaceae bacterium]|nr:hypothetical protein [Sandaracinaceae bacterium]